MVDISHSPDKQASGSDSAADAVAAIPLLEERLSLTKRKVESGRVRVRVNVEERQETVTDEIVRDELQVQRVPRNVRVSEEPHVRLEGNTTIVPVVEERLVVEKVLVLVEEIHISRTSTTETKQIPVSLRTERASVERDDAHQSDEHSGASQ